MPRFNPHQPQTIPDDLSDRGRQEQSSSAEWRVLRVEEPPLRVVIPHVPDCVEFGGQPLEEKGDPVRLARCRSGLDDAREFRRTLDECEARTVQESKIGFAF